MKLTSETTSTQALRLSAEMHLAMLMVAPGELDVPPMPAEMVGAGLGVLMRHILALQERVEQLEVDAREGRLN